MKLNPIKYFKFLFLLGLLMGCEELINEEPVGRFSTNLAYSNLKNTEGTVAGMYGTFRSSNSYRWYLFDRIQSMSDEMIYTNNAAEQKELANNTISPMNGIIKNVWDEHYNIIFNTNDIIENVPGASIPENLKPQFIGEAVFIRAWCYFVLLQLWDAVPLVISTDWASTALLPRSDKQEVLNYIIDDLVKVADDLPASYDSYLGQRTRATSWAAKALLSKLYLYTGNFEKAETTATEIIDSEVFTLPQDISLVLTNNSTESIWEVWTNTQYFNYLYVFIPGSPTSPPDYAPSESLLSAFDSQDKRLGTYVKFQVIAGDTLYAYCSKYPTRPQGTDRPKMIRLAEVYLLRAEAKNGNGDQEGAIKDINSVRTRAGLNELPPSLNQIQVDQEILLERERELCFEGHRWFDLQRFGVAKSVLELAKTGFTDKALLLPIPNQELLNNPNLTQNPGW